MVRFYLLVDTKFLYCYLASKWIEAFDAHPCFAGILARKARPADEFMARRVRFHAEHAGRKTLTREMEREAAELYRDFGAESRTSIRLFGVPRHPVSGDGRTVFLGDDLNAVGVRAWLNEHVVGREVWVFSHVGQLLRPWWVEACGGRLLNVHMAVLPHARGTNAIQQVAARGEEIALRRAAGASVHYIDAGVDTGAPVRIERLREPLRFADLWELLAHIYDLGDNLYLRTARDIVDNPDSEPVGIASRAAALRPNYQRRDFNPARRRKAEQAYLAMREAWLGRTQGVRA